MGNTAMQKFMDGFTDRVMMIVAEQLQVQGASFPLEVELDKREGRTYYYAFRGPQRLLLCIVHDPVFVQEGDDFVKNEITVRQDVQVPKSDGSFITLS